MNELSSDRLIDNYLDRTRLDRFLDEVETANRKFNLFSRNLERRELELLAAESLLPLHQGWINDDSGTILDIGSGWGIPAIPLLLSGLKTDITMLERSQKKADFLYLLLHRLGLSAEVISKNLNDLHEEQKYEVILLRGVSLNSKLRRRIENLMVSKGNIIYFGVNFPQEWLHSAEVFNYSIDKSPARTLINYSFQ